MCTFLSSFLQYKTVLYEIVCLNLKYYSLNKKKPTNCLWEDKTVRQFMSQNNWPRNNSKTTNIAASGDLWRTRCCCKNIFHSLTFGAVTDVQNKVVNLIEHTTSLQLLLFLIEKNTIQHDSGLPSSLGVGKWQETKHQ